MTRKTALFLSVILAATSFAGCKGEEQITATTKDIPVYNEEATNLSGNEKNVEQPVKETTPDMSKYIEKEYVEANYVRKDEVQTMIDEAVEKALGATSGSKQTTSKGPKGDKGDPGRGISAVAISETGDLCIAYTDGTFEDVGLVRGAKGDKGDPGAQGEKGDPGEQGERGFPGRKGDKGEDGKPADVFAEDFQKIGYVVPINSGLPFVYNLGYVGTVTITAVSMKLAVIDTAYARKYGYEYSISYDADIKTPMETFLDDTEKPKKTLTLSVGYEKNIGREGTYNIDVLDLRLPNSVGQTSDTYTGTLMYTEDPILDITSFHTAGSNTDDNPVYY